MRTSFFTIVSLAGLGLATAQSSSSSSLSSLVFNTSGLSGQSATASYLPSSAESSSGPAFTTHGPISLSTSVTLTSASTSASAATSAASSSTASATRNAQVKVQVGKQDIVGVVGLMAGVLALVA